MSNIAASDVTYALVKQRKLSDSRNLNLVRLTFGDGALTYPANGIPITKGKCGCPTVIESMVIVDKGASGYIFQYDQSAEKLIMMQAPAQTHGHDLSIIGGQAAATTNAIANYAGVLGKNEAGNVAYTAGTAVTNGGVLSKTLAAAALAEASTVAIAQQIIEVEVIGW